MDAITEFAWIAWLVLILIFVIVEMLSLAFIFLMLAVGSVAGLVSGLLGAPWWLQLLIAAVASVLLLFAIRPPLLRLLKRGGDSAPTNVQALLGMAGTVVSTVGAAGGQVRLENGETWTARSAVGEVRSDLAPGERVLVIKIDGATAVVAPTETTTERLLP